MIYFYNDGTAVYQLTEENKEFVIENAVAITGEEFEILKQSNLPPLDHHVIFKGIKSENKVVAVFIKNEKTIEQIRQEAIEELMLEMINGGEF